MDKYTRPDFDKSALITIDVLRDTLDGQPLEIPGTSAALPKMKQLLDFYRKINKPIVHIVRIYKADGSNVDLCRRELVESRAEILTENSLGAELAQELFGNNAVRYDTNFLLNGGVQKISDNEVIPANVIQYHPDEGSLESEWIRKTMTSYMDSTGTLWLATNGAGLLRLREKKMEDANHLDFEVTIFTTSHGLCNNHIASIMDDFKGNLWLGTHNGLSKFNQINESFTNYSLKHGLPSNRFLFESAGMSENGELFFGSANGMISFHPDSIQTNQ